MSSATLPAPRRPADAVRSPAVLVVGHTYVVGVNQGKLEALAAAGAAVAVLVPRSWPEPEWGFDHRLERAAPSVRFFPSPVWAAGRSGAYVYPPARVRNALRAFSPDLINVEQELYSLSAFETARWARRTGRPLVMFCWENVDRRLSPVRRRARDRVLATASAIVCGSEGAADLVRRWGFRRRIEVLPQLGVDTTLFAPAGRRDGAGGLRIGYAGRLVPQKGIDLLLDAVGALRVRGCDVELVVSGSGPAEPELRARAARLGLDGAVRWAGAVTHEQVPSRMRDLDVLVLPSRATPTWREQFGHVLVEAMAMGIPVVGSSCGAIPEVIGRCDAVFREGDAGALTEILERLAREPERRAELSRWGLERVRERYTNERIAQRLVELYRDVLREAAG